MNAPRTPRASSNEGGTSPLGSRSGIFRHLAARSLKLNRTRSIVSIIGIALSCALITAIFTSVVTLYGGLLKAEIVTDGTWQVELVNVPEDELDTVHADTRVEESYDRISYGDALMPKSFEGYWGRYLSVQEWPTADAVGDLKPLPTIPEGRAPEAADEIVLNLDLKGMTVENGRQLYDALPSTVKDADAPRASWDGALEIGSTIELALGQRMFVDAESGTEIPCLYDESLYTTTTDKGDVISEYLADIEPARTYKVVGFYAPKNAQAMDVWLLPAWIFGLRLLVRPPGASDERVPHHQPYQSRRDRQVHRGLHRPRPRPLQRRQSGRPREHDRNWPDRRVFA